MHSYTQKHFDVPHHGDAVFFLILITWQVNAPNWADPMFQLMQRFVQLMAPAVTCVSRQNSDIDGATSWIGTVDDEKM